MIVEELRNAWRGLLTRPAHTALSIGILSLGLGAMLFTLGIVNGIVLEPLPFPHAERLVAVGHSRTGSRSVGSLTGADFLLVEEALSGIEPIAAYAEIDANLRLSPGHGLRHYAGVAVSHGLLDLLGVKPIRGRDFAPADDQPGAPLTVMLGEQTWRNDFGADTKIIGRGIQVNGETATVIAVLPSGFAFPRVGEIWLPRRLARDDWRESQVVGLLKPAVSPTEAQAELDAIAQNLGSRLQGQRDHRRLMAVPLSERFADPTTRRYLWMMFATGLMVLLIACVNVGNLLLARAQTRRRELALRSVLGAHRGLLLRTLLFEVLILSITATVTGLLLAEFGGRWLLDLLLTNELTPAYYVNLGVDTRMLGFGLAAALITTLAAGLWPALEVASDMPHTALRDGDKGSPGSFARMMRGLVTAEIALTMILLIAAMTFAKGLQALATLDLGSRADPARILTARIELYPGQYPSSGDRIALYGRLAARLNAIPGVAAASVATAVPGVRYNGHELLAAEGEAGPADSFLQATQGRVDEHFLDTYDIPLIAGRNFDERDRADSEPVVIIDQRLAERLWPGRDPLGHQLRLNPQREDAQSLTVVGITAALNLGDENDYAMPSFLLPLRQHPVRWATLAIRTLGDAAVFAPRLTAAVHAEDADIPVYESRTQQQGLRIARIGPVVLTQVFSSIGLLALLLAAAGLYGVLAFAVAQRTREIGIRRAVGAGRGGIVRATVAHTAGQLGIGLTIGIALGLPWSGLLADPLMQTRGYDWPVFTVVIFVIAAAALAASLVPLRRALQIDPMEALRYE